MIDYNTMSYQEGRALLKQAGWGEYADRATAALKDFGNRGKSWMKTDPGNATAAAVASAAGPAAAATPSILPEWLNNRYAGRTLGGALGGAGLGLASSAFQRKGKKTPWSRMLTGGILGGLGGLATNPIEDIFKADNHSGVAGIHAEQNLKDARRNSQIGFGSADITGPDGKAFPIPGMGAPHPGTVTGSTLGIPTPAPPEIMRHITKHDADGNVIETANGRPKISLPRLAAEPFRDAASGIGHSLRREYRSVVGEEKGLGGAFTPETLPDTAKLVGHLGATVLPFTEWDPYRMLRTRYVNSRIPARLAKQLAGGKDGMGTGIFGEGKLLGSVEGTDNAARVAFDKAMTARATMSNPLQDIMNPRNRGAMMGAGVPVDRMRSSLAYKPSTIGNVGRAVLYNTIPAIVNRGYNLATGTVNRDDIEDAQMRAATAQHNMNVANGIRE